MSEVQGTPSISPHPSDHRQKRKHGGAASPPRASFPPQDRLRRRQDYLRVQREGKKFETPHFGIWLAPAPGGGPRLGLVVGRKIGQATRRNRVKRLVREFFRRHKHVLPPKEIVIQAKKGASDLTYAQVVAELARILLPPFRAG